MYYLYRIPLFLALLVSYGSFATSAHSVGKKLYAQDLIALGFDYSKEIKYVTDREKYTIPLEQLKEIDKNLSQKYGDFVVQRYEAAWTVMFIDDHIGYGVFAEEDLEPWQFIGEYTGIIVNKELNCFLYDNAYTWNISVFSEYFPQRILYVDAKKVCNFTRFVNHSYTPNVATLSIYAEGGWHVIYVACKPIKKGEQLLVDYGHGYWQYRYEPNPLN